MTIKDAKSLHTLIRRLTEQHFNEATHPDYASEESSLWASDIMSACGYEWI